MMRNLLSLLILTATFVTGCTTDQPIFTNQRKARLEGVELYNRADYENAAGTFRNAIHQDPRDYRSSYYQGVTYERLNNYQQAIQAYKSSLKVMRETPVGREDINFRQIVMNQLAACIAKYDSNHLEQQLLMNQASNLKNDAKDRAESYFLLAKVERYRRDADGALVAYYKGSELDRDDVWLQKEAGLYILKVGKVNQSYKSIQAAHDLDARDEEIRAAMVQLKLNPKTQLTPPAGDGGVPTLFATKELPNVELKMTDTPVALPDQFPMD